jgi:hypothetical protein
VSDDESVELGGPAEQVREAAHGLVAGAEEERVAVVVLRVVAQAGLPRELRRTQMRLDVLPHLPEPHPRHARHHPPLRVAGLPPVTHVAPMRIGRSDGSDHGSSRLSMDQRPLIDRRIISGKCWRVDRLDTRDFSAGFSTVVL